MSAAPDQVSPRDEATIRPRLVVSRCLGFEACRYDGQILSDHFVDRLSEHVEIITVCPEVAIGLGTPREPIRLVRQGDAIRLLQQHTERDLTDEMSGFAESWLDEQEEFDGALLKNRSPSCAVFDAKIHAGLDRAPSLGAGPGMFAAALLKRHPHAAVEDEGRLSNLGIRHHFLSRLFTLAEFRTRIRARPSMGALVDFHSRHKHLLMAHHQEELRTLGRIVANSERLPVAEAIARYGAHLGPALERPARPGATINVLEHAYGYVSERLSPAERDFFHRLLRLHGEDALPLSAVLTTLQAWIIRFEVDYLAAQSFYAPYPEALIEQRDSGRSHRARPRR